MRFRLRITLAVVRLFGRLGLIEVPYGDYQAAMGNNDVSDERSRHDSY